LAADFGADLTADAATVDPAKALRKATGGGADIVIDVTAKAPVALGQAVNLAKAGGTVVLAGTRGSAETPGFWPDNVVYKELRMLGALGVDTASYLSALDLLKTGRYPFAELPRRCASLAETESLLQSMAGTGDGSPPVHGVVTPWGSDSADRR
jgi:alcohol dehydrogenase